MKLKRRQLVKALAYCVEALCKQALIDASGAINAAMKCDEIWDELNSETIEILDKGLGIKQP